MRQDSKGLIKGLILTLLYNFGIIALNGCFFFTSDSVHFLPPVAFMGSNEFMNLKMFCKWEGPAHVYIMLG